MAQSLSASIYGANENTWNKTQGVIMGFPTQSVLIRALVPAVSYSGASCNTVIELLPTGSRSVSVQYYTPTATVTVISAANA